MWGIIKSISKVFLWTSTFVGLVYLPADVYGLTDTYPFLARVTELERETLLIGFSILLLVYLTFVEVRPHVARYRALTSWVEAEDAAKMIFEHIKSSQQAVQTLKNRKSNESVIPYSGAVAPWFEEGINDGELVAIGHEDHLEDYVDIPKGVKVQDGKMFGTLGNLKEDLCAIADDGRKLIGIRFNRTSLEKYIRTIRSDLK